MATIIEKTSRMHNPAHPGEILRQMYLKPRGITVTRAAEALGVTRQALSALLNRRSGVSVEMATRLSQALGTSAEMWINMQAAYALWKARPRPKPKMKPLARKKAA
jgi:addiction module HigA family antidote